MEVDEKDLINNDEGEGEGEGSSQWQEIVDDEVDPDAEVLIEGVDDEIIKAQTKPSTDGLASDGVSREELIKRISQLDETTKSLKQQQDTNALIQNSFQELAKTLKGGGSAAPQPAATFESEEAFNERMRELAHDDPTKLVNEVLVRKVSPILNGLAGNNLKTSRTLLTLDPVNGPLYQRFQEEVDREVQAAPDYEKLNNSELYHQKLSLVKTKHFDDLVMEQAKKIADEAVKKSGKDVSLLNNGGTKPATPPPVRQYSETNYNPKAPTTERKILGTLTPEEKRQADVKGIPYKDYYLSLKRRGLK